MTIEALATRSTTGLDTVTSGCDLDWNGWAFVDGDWMVLIQEVLAAAKWVFLWSR